MKITSQKKPTTVEESFLNAVDQGLLTALCDKEERLAHFEVAA
jgi:hypothetical protein